MRRPGDSEHLRQYRGHKTHQWSASITDYRNRIEIGSLLGIYLKVQQTKLKLNAIGSCYIIFKWRKEGKILYLQSNVSIPESRMVTSVVSEDVPRMFDA